MAVPNPERELARLEKTLQRDPAKGLPSCLLISGASGFFRNEAFELALAAVPGDVDLRSVDGDQDSDGRELHDLRGGNLFGRGAVVAVRRGEGWLKRHGEALVAVLPKIAPASSLLLEVQKLDKRTRLAKAILAAGAIFEFRDLYTEPYDRSRSPLEAEMVSWITSRSRKMGCPLTAESAYQLMCTVGTRPAEIVQELARVAVAVGPVSRPLGPQDLRGKLTSSFDSTPFEFAEALLAFDRGRATRSLTAMYERGTRGRDGGRIDQGGLFPFITSWLYQSMTQVLEGRLLVDRGVAIDDVPGRLGVRVFTDRLVEQLRRNPTERLRRGVRLLHECQRELRTTGEDPHWLLLGFLARYFAAQEVPA